MLKRTKRSACALTIAAGIGLATSVPHDADAIIGSSTWDLWRLGSGTACLAISLNGLHQDLAALMEEGFEGYRYTEEELAAGGRFSQDQQISAGCTAVGWANNINPPRRTTAGAFQQLVNNRVTSAIGYADLAAVHVKWITSMVYLGMADLTAPLQETCQALTRVSGATCEPEFMADLVETVLDHRDLLPQLIKHLDMSSPHDLHRVFDVAGLTQVARGQAIGPERQAALEALTDVLREHAPGLVDGSPGGPLDADSARLLHERLSELADTVTRGESGIAIDPTYGRTVRDLTWDAGLIAMAEGELPSAEELRETIERLKTLVEIDEELKEAISGMNIGGLDPEQAAKLHERLFRMRYPDAPEVPDYIASFVLGQEQVVHVSVGPRHFDVTEPAYRATRRCVEESAGLRVRSPGVVAAIQSTIQGTATVREMTGEERDDLGEGFTRTMSAAPVLGAISGRYLLGYTPQEAVMGNKPSERDIASAQSIRRCAIGHHSALEVHTMQDEHYTLVAALMMANTVQMNPQDEQWNLLGNLVAAAGTVTEGQWEELEAGLNPGNSSAG